MFSLDLLFGTDQAQSGAPEDRITAVQTAALRFSSSQKLSLLPKANGLELMATLFRALAMYGSTARTTGFVLV